MRTSEEVLSTAEEADIPQEERCDSECSDDERNPGEFAIGKKPRKRHYVDPKYENQNLAIDGVRESFARIYDYVDVLVGLCFIAMGIFTIAMYKNFGITREDFTMMTWLALFTMFFGGTLMIINPRRTFNTSIGIYAITMGVISFSSYWDSLSEVETASGLLSIFTDIMFLAELVMVGFSVNLMISGISYLRGRPRGTIGMMNKAAFMGGINVFSLLLMVRTGEYASVIEALKCEPVTTIQIVMFFVFLNMMDTDEARSYNTKNRLRNSTEALRHLKTVDDKAYVELVDAQRLADPSFAGWRRVTDGGPAEWEYVFAINSSGGASSVTVQRWRGSDKFYLTISDHRYGSIIRATRLSVDHIAMTEDQQELRIHGSDHFIIRIGVRLPLDQYTIKGGDAE